MTSNLSKRDKKIIYISFLKKTKQKEGGHWGAFGYFLDWFFGFCAKKLWFFGFGVHCGLQIFRFLTLGFGFSPEILMGFWL